ncbi:hypothetical protein LCGC14_2567950 [marine sediment metagenome]|uniref:Molybdopterin synthase sulfur carrier subunit n=1 Tax=marine sediment metagenome TaxID=412755 RepID=A0A0F9AIM7_9ZZZZ
MEVQVRLFAGFREGRFNRRAVEVPDGSCLGDLFEQLDLPKGRATIRMVNGRHAELDCPLAADDVVAIFPAIAGG